MLSFALVAVLAATAFSAHAAEFVLSDFNNAGLQYTFDGFSQTIGPTALRLRDPTNGWGGAGRTQFYNLSTMTDGRLVVDVAANPGNGVDNFTLELYDNNGNSGKWDFLAPPPTGSFNRLVSKTTLAAPTSGVNDYQHLNLAQISSWNILGQWASPEPFDMSFDRVAISSSVPPPPPYAGYELDAPWRAEAAARIDAIRKADMTVRVRDPAGVPLPGVDVHVQMQEHEFGFGSAVVASHIAGASPDDAQYRAVVQQLFNRATLENDLKWPAWVGEYGPTFNQTQSKNAIAWLNSQDIKVRGHNLVWPGSGDGYLPASIRNLVAQTPLTEAQQQSLRSAIAAHIADEAGQIAATINSWDVVNEPRANHAVMDALPEGNHAMVDWFNAAHAADPAAKLFVNEYDILASGGATSTYSQQAFYDTLQYLIDQGAPIDGLGMQSHFSESSLTGPEQIWDIADRFEQLGLKMNVTEFTFDTEDEQLQAAYTRDFLTAIFAHEGFDELSSWGFWEGALYDPSAAMFRNDWSIKPNGQAFMDLVFNQWWTDEELQSAAGGTASLRGFKGKYLVTVDELGHNIVVPATLSTGGQTLDVTMPQYAADFDGNGRVDQNDLAAWTGHFGLASGATREFGDANGDGAVDGADLAIWQRELGMSIGGPAAATIPEPPTGLFGLCALSGLLGRRRRSAAA